MSGADVDLRALAETGPVHFVGIGGAGMCALAELLVRSGGEVSGCDVKDGRALERLSRLGVSITVGHDPTHVANASAIVTTSAVTPEHPELIAAKQAGKPVLKRAAALGAWVARGRVVAVAGTHGKTSTTAMATEVLAAAGYDPTGLVGGRVIGWDGNLRFGSEALYVVEADEYDRSFLELAPDIAVVTNVQADHLDTYGDLAGVEAGFRQFLSGLRDGGRVIACADDHGAASLLPGVGDAGYTYGTSAGSMLRATEVSMSARGTSCRVFEEGRPAGELEVPRGGRHTLLNALAAAAVARTLDVPWSAISAALSGFRGVGRRFELLGDAGGITIIDDYAHHPTEITATLAAARGLFEGTRLVAVFQPHLYSRTRDFASDFGKALSGADEVWVTDVFPAREAPIPGITGDTIAQAARAAGAPAVHYHPGLDTLHGVLAERLRHGDLVLTLGAGSVELLGPRLLEALAEAVHA